MKTSADVLREVEDLVPEDAIGFDIESLKETSFCLQEGEDVALFEKKAEGVFSGHYFFRSRGKTALEVAKRMIEYAFADDVTVIQGLTPLDNKKALWFTRRLGFTFLDVLETPAGPMQLSYLTKKDYK